MKKLNQDVTDVETKLSEQIKLLEIENKEYDGNELKFQK